MKDILKQDGPALTGCAAIFSYCSFTNLANIMQQVGYIASGLAAVVILCHRLYVWRKDTKNDR